MSHMLVLQKMRLNPLKKRKKKTLRKPNSIDGNNSDQRCYIAPNGIIQLLVKTFHQTIRAWVLSLFSGSNTLKIFKCDRNKLLSNCPIYSILNTIEMLKPTFHLNKMWERLCLPIGQS